MCGYFIKNYFLYLIAVITSVLAAFLAGNIPAIKPITKQKTRIPNWLAEQDQNSPIKRYR